MVVPLNEDLCLPFAHCPLPFVLCPLPLMPSGEKKEQSSHAKPKKKHETPNVPNDGCAIDPWKIRLFFLLSHHPLLKSPLNLSLSILTLFELFFFLSHREDCSSVVPLFDIRMSSKICNPLHRFWCIINTTMRAKARREKKRERERKEERMELSGWINTPRKEITISSNLFLRVPPPITTHVIQKNNYHV